MHVKLDEGSNYFVGPNKWCISLLNDHIKVGNRFEVYIYFMQNNESNPLAYRQDTEKRKMKAPSQQDMVYFDHIKKRQDNKGCLYATYVLV